MCEPSSARAATATARRAGATQAPSALRLRELTLMPAIVLAIVVGTFVSPTRS